jgi:poly(A) polymerase Pap1
MKIMDGGLNDPLHNLQRNFVSNAVSNAKKLVNAMANFSGQKLIKFGENRTSESTGEQEIWA